MGQFLEFIANHWMLASLWVVLVLALVLYQQARAGKALSPHQVTLLVNRSNAAVLDVRDKKDFDRGHIVDAVNIPLAKLSERLPELEKKKESPLIVVCEMGQHSGAAVKTLQVAGFTQVSRLSGGLAEWRAQSLPLVT
ncbi:MAG: rhodanese-like domain-containing protein [Pseudomonadales bacterium]|nr:rhodanese-like domain-containing protein [Pseudomonadales bacterium]